jgi:hypothetical protein
LREAEAEGWDAMSLDSKPVAAAHPAFPDQHTEARMKTGHSIESSRLQVIGRTAVSISSS